MHPGLWLRFDEASFVFASQVSKVTVLYSRVTV